MSKDILKDLFISPYIFPGLPLSCESKKENVVNGVLNRIALITNQKVEDILGKSRDGDIVYARHIAMFILRDKLKLRFEEIGKILGGRHHSSVISGYQKIKDTCDMGAKIERKNGKAPMNYLILKEKLTLISQYARMKYIDNKLIRNIQRTNIDS